MVDRHDNLRRRVEAPERTVFPTAVMRRHGDPVAALDPFQVLLQPLHPQRRTALRRGQVRQVQRIHENLSQSPVEPSPDRCQLPLVLLRKRIPKVLLHHRHPVPEAVTEQKIEQILHHVILEPTGQHRKDIRTEPEYLQPHPLHEIQVHVFHRRLPVKVPRKVSRFRPSSAAAASSSTSRCRQAATHPCASPRRSASYRAEPPKRRT